MKPGEGLKRVSPDCYEDRDHTGVKLICGENRSTMIFTKARGRVASKIKIDGCVVKNATACDYVVHDWMNRYHFVELKGGDVEKAFVQLVASIPLFLPSGTKEKFWCFVVCTKYPPFIRPGVQNAAARLKKRWPGAISKVKESTCTHPLTD